MLSQIKYKKFFFFQLVVKVTFLILMFNIKKLTYLKNKMTNTDNIFFFYGNIFNTMVILKVIIFPKKKKKLA